MTDNYCGDPEIDSQEAERRAKFCSLSDLMHLYSLMDTYGDDETTFTFDVTLTNGTRRTIMGEDVDRILVCDDVYCYAFIHKSGYVDFVNCFTTKIN